MFTNKSCLLLGPSENLGQGTIIGEKGSDNLYRLLTTLDKPKGKNVLNAQLDLPKIVSEKPWKIAAKKNGPRIAPAVTNKQAHDTLNHTHAKILEWFRKEYPLEMQHMEKLCVTQQQKSCPPCGKGKATRTPFKQKQKNIYALLEAVSSDTTGPITPTDADGKKFVQILVDACSGWTDVQITGNKSEAGNAIMRLLAKIQRTCEMNAKRLHTDGAKEQNTKNLQASLDNNGTAATHTAPNASQSNYFAERRLRQLMAAARTEMASAPHMPRNFWSYAVLYAAYKGNYLATAKDGKLQPSPNANIKALRPNAKFSNPASFLPW